MQEVLVRWSRSPYGYIAGCSRAELFQIAKPTSVNLAKKENVMQEKKQSLVELALSLGFTAAAEDDPIYSDGVVIISTIGSELEKLEQIDREEL